MLAKVAGAITARGADIVALGTFWGDDPTNRELVIKIQGITSEEIEQIVDQLEAEIVDVRET